MVRKVTAIARFKKGTVYTIGGSEKTYKPKYVDMVMEGRLHLWRFQPTRRGGPKRKSRLTPLALVRERDTMAPADISQMTGLKRGSQEIVVRGDLARQAISDTEEAI